MRKILFFAFTLLIISFSSCSSGRRAVRQQQEERLREVTASWVGTPYRYGGMSRRGTDCSGFTMAVYKDVYGITLAHNSKTQLKENCRKELSKSKLKTGDLVFFVTNGKRTRKRNINHVGIYLGDGKFIHASTKRGVIINHLNDVYYQKNWVTGGRVKGR